MDEIEKIRKNIDKIDDNILICLRNRMKEVEKLGEHKAKSGIPVLSKKREKEILAKTKTKMEKEVFSSILKHSKKAQKEL